MVNIRPRKLLTMNRRAKVASAIKHYVVTLIGEKGSTMSATRDTIRVEKRINNLTPAVCESWATGLGLEGLMFADADILAFVIKALGIEVDEQTDDCLFKYGKYTYTYDLQEVVDFYWKTVGEVLCWC